MSNFAERLVLRSSEGRGLSSIKPAIVPDTLPEIFILPTQNIRPSQPFTSLVSINEPQGIDLQANQSKKLEPSAEGDEEAERVPRVPSDGQPKVRIQPKVVSSEISSKSLEPSAEGDEEAERVPRVSSDGQPKVRHQLKVVSSEISSKLGDMHVDEALDTDLRMSQDIEKSVQNFPSDSFRTRIEDQRPEHHNPLGETGLGTEQPNDDVLGRSDLHRIQPKKLPIMKPGEIPENTLNVSRPTQQSLTVSTQTKTEFPSEPSVTISIGRIEVRAMMPQKTLPNESNPRLSLEEYLKRRREVTT